MPIYYKQKDILIYAHYNECTHRRTPRITLHISGVDFWTDPSLGRGAENLTFLVEPSSNRAVRAVLDNANINYEVRYLNDTMSVHII